jgi:hypothetical protein
MNAMLPSSALMCTWHQIVFGQIKLTDTIVGSIDPVVFVLDASRPCPPCVLTSVYCGVVPTFLCHESKDDVADIFGGLANIEVSERAL